MRRILFVIGQMRIGGVSKALAELLHSIHEQYDISLLCFDDEGDYLSDIPSDVQVLHASNLLKMTEKSARDMRNAGLQYVALRVFLSTLTKLFGKKWSAKLLVKLIGAVPGEYDVAISFAHPMPDKMFCNLGPEIILHCAKAKRKAVFVHCDFAAYGGDSKYNRELLQKFDKIAVVSDSVGRTLVSCAPMLAPKVHTVHNCHDFEKIRKLAEDKPVTYTADTTFVTVARLSQEKGLLRCIPAFARIRQAGYKVQWHIVGNGPIKDELEKAIREHDLENCVILEGAHVNPYRFMRNGDYLLVPSYHEAAPMVFDEAMALGLRVISTRTLSAEELVAARGIGIVCDNTDEGLEQAIRCVVTKEKPAVHAKQPISNGEAIREFIALCGE